MDRLVMANATSQLKNLPRTHSFCHKIYPLAYARTTTRDLGLKTIPCMLHRTTPCKQKSGSRKDAVALHRELKAFQGLLRRSLINDRLPSGGLSTSYGLRLFSTSSKNRNNERDTKNKDGKKKEEGPQPYVWSLAALSAAVLAVAMLEYFKIRITWQEFVTDLLLQGKVKEVFLYKHEEYKHKGFFGQEAFEVELVEVKLHPSATIQGKMPSKWRAIVIESPRVGFFVDKLDALEDELGVPDSERLTVNFHRRYLSPFEVLVSFALVVLVVLNVYFISRSIGSSNTASRLRESMGMGLQKTIKPVKVDSGKKISFKDVAGLKEAKQEVLEFVDYLKAPQRFKELGAKTPRGALLLGPPGCGKTLLAKALAAESDVPFFNMAGSEFVEMIGGLGAQRVRKLFQEARKKTPCIIYIDEIDAIGRKRDRGFNNEEEAQTLNQLLSEMDGMSTVEGVIVFAATNRADMLDQALLRPGRFDRHITIDHPTFLERVELFDLYLSKLKLSKPVSTFSRRLAHLTPGMTGADIQNVCNEAAIKAARDGQKFVMGADLEMAIERVVAGSEKKNSPLSPPEKKIVAYHESGHALVGWLLEHTDALLKVTIVPRTSNVLGFAQYRPSDQKLYTKEELFERMCMALGGRVSEAIIFNSVTNGAKSDLEMVTKMAYNQIKCYGMSESLGHLSFDHNEESTFQKKPYSKRLAALIDEEARALVSRAYQYTENVLEENKDKLQLLAQTLLERETLSYADVENLIGPPPYGKKKVMDIYPHFEGHIPTNGPNGETSNPDTVDNNTKEKTEKFSLLNFERIERKF